MFTNRQLWQGIDQLAKIKKISPSKMATNAGLDPTCLNHSKRLSPERKLRWISTQSLCRILKTTNTSLSEFAKIVESSSK